jgi:hypothetical protein
LPASAEPARSEAALDVSAAPRRPERASLRLLVQKRAQLAHQALERRLVGEVRWFFLQDFAW